LIGTDPSGTSELAEAAFLTGIFGGFAAAKTYIFCEFAKGGAPTLTKIGGNFLAGFVVGSIYGAIFGLSSVEDLFLVTPSFL